MISDSIQPYNLVIDYGNSFTKVAIFKKNEQIELIISDNLQISDLAFLKEKYLPVDAIVSSVVDLPQQICNFLEHEFNFIELTHTTPVPIINQYRTPKTLGRDRLSVVVAAYSIFPGQPVLVIDAGTCVTFDFIDADSKYHGGGIAPGIDMRFKALHTFTQRLPLVKNQKFEGLSGTTTEESILSGVLNGVIVEFDGVINAYQENYPGLKVIVTGGDVNFFDKKLKSNIFAVPNLVLKGLNVILSFNVNKQQEPN